MRKHVASLATPLSLVTETVEWDLKAKCLSNVVLLVSVHSWVGVPQIHLLNNFGDHLGLLSQL